jgi:hypothetical protein
LRKYTIRTYQPTDYETWNSFVKVAKNATFLFHRDFMEYHADRFTDYSLMIFDGIQLIAVIPGNKADNVFYSHQGLTYGGIVVKENLGGEKIEEILKATLIFLTNNCFSSFRIKSFPFFNDEMINQNLDYFLWKSDAKIYERNMNLVIDLKKEIKIAKSKRKKYAQNLSLPLEFVRETSFDAFWNNILTPRLWLKHQVKPVHSLEEITQLAIDFPENIIQYSVYLKGEILSGITIFKDKKSIKSQYGATSDLGEKYRALDFLYIKLMDLYMCEIDFFDLGTVNSDHGQVYFKGLLKQKEELGATTFIHDYYEIKL